MTLILAKLQAEGSVAASVFYNYSFRDACENNFSQNFQTGNSGNSKDCLYSKFPFIEVER